MRRKLLIGSAVTLAVVASGAFGYYQLVRAGVLRYNKYDRREKGALAIGATSPDLRVTMYDGSAVQLAQLWEKKPVFLVFGSCT